MTPQQLKNAILQQAIQGKLVEQRAEEGTSQELFEAIQDEKNNLIKEGKLKKQKALPEITEEEIPFEIPETWKWVKLGEISTYSQTKMKINVAEIETPMWSLDLEDIEKESGKIIRRVMTNDRKISGEKIIFKKGQILYSKLRPYLKKILIAPDNGVCSSELVPFDMIGNCDSRFIVYVLKSAYVDFLINSVTYGVKMPRVGTDTMINLLIPLPPLDMQKAILGQAIQGKLVEQRAEEGTGQELFEAIQEEKQKLIEEGKLKKQKALPEITEDEIPFEIPDTWKWVKYGDILNIVSAKRVHQSDWQNKGIPFYRAREISKLSKFGTVDNDLFISEELFNSLSVYGLPEKNDLMVTAVGTLGKTYIVKENDRFYYKDASVLCFKNYAQINAMFLKYAMESSLMKNQIEANSRGTTVGTLTIVRTSNYIIPLPPLDEQKRIVEKIEELLPLVEKLK